jgi:glycosyltransferase involved in cell wall biosynthesis
MISIVIPVYNEELIIQQSTLRVLEFCQKNISGDWQIILSDNASSDQTGAFGKKLASEHEAIKYFYLGSQGKGRAVMSAWQNFPSAVYIFMDIDLSVGLSALPLLIKEIKAGSDIAVGSRFLAGSIVDRSLARKLFSIFLRAILWLIFGLRVKDAPCGFKAVNQKIVDTIIPQVKNQTWFFDTEILVLSERVHYKIKEIPVVWQEAKNIKRKSKVGLFKVISEYLKNIYRLYSSRH